MIQRVFKYSEVVLVLILLGICLVFSVISPYFLKVDNLFLISGQMVELGLLAIGMSVALISGGFDLSIGALGSFATVLLGIFIGRMGLSMWLGMLIVLIATLLFGALNGFLCGFLKLEPMLATLGTSGLIAGLSLGIARSDVILIKNPDYIFGKMRIGGVIPLQFLIYFAAIFVAVILLNYTRWGRRVYMLGCNKSVAGYSGINVRKTTFMVYIFSAFMSFLAAVVVSSRLESGKATVLDPLVLQAVTAAMFGGISIKGGSGNIIGAVIGVVTFSVISNGLNMIGLSQFLKQVIQGVVLLGVLAYNIWREKRR